MSLVGALRRFIYNRDGGVCQICGRPVGPEERFELDHIRSKFHGGEDDVDNLQLAHRICNRRKDWGSGNKPRAWREQPAPTSEATIWDAQTVIEAIQLYAQKYGHPPSAQDFNMGMARKNGREDVVERFYEDGQYPHYGSVLKFYGSWNKAIEAAGFTPLRKGERRTQRQRRPTSSP